MSDNSSVASSSSSSDDEFLTVSAGGQEDREALVRKKLLESFYGASAVRDEHKADAEHDDEEHDDEAIDVIKEDSSSIHQEIIITDNNTSTTAISNVQSQSSSKHFKSPSQISLPFTATKAHLDSPSFCPLSHTTSHIAHSSVRTLLEIDESLATDIRHLDSTMQTLVYENYSKFINATDAIKNIGTNVTSTGFDSLDRLTVAVDRIQKASERSEAKLRASREAVAEKLRIQRLLVRLDALLCLPATLRSSIDKGQWRSAVKSHKQATEILGRHSAGFESLRCIEEECCGILQGLVLDLKDKLFWWSGRSRHGANTLSSSITSSFARVDDAKIEEAESIAQIFECAGTLLMLHETAFCPGLDGNECRTLALEACGNFLKERLIIASPLEESPVVEGAADGASDSPAVELPISFLDGLLEATTLYGVSFRDTAFNRQSDQALLGDFVTGNFDKFIGRVRSILFQQSGNGSHDEVDDEEAKDDANFQAVSLALSRLIQSVRELASGLALPEVGLDVSIASSLVDQAVELTEMLVRRRVTMKFYSLREVVVKDCLAPLVSEIIASQNRKEEKGDEETKSPMSLAEMIQLANVALSDGLQMADDLIRATLQRSESDDRRHGVNAPVDSAVVKLAVQKNARLFGVWLASSLETLVGCEPSTDDSLLEVTDERDKDNEDKDDERKQIEIPVYESDEEYNNFSSSMHSLSRNLSSEESTKDECSSALNAISLQMDDEATDQTYSNFILAVCEMCRLAERSIANTLNQSIQSAMEEESRIAESADTLFAASLNPYRKGKDVLDAEMVLAQRFKLAASRALTMYIMNRGSIAATELCNEMQIMSDTRDPYAIPSQPREECLKVFELVKSTCEDCISIVGGDLFSSPVAPYPEDQEYSEVFGSRMTQQSGKDAASRGLQLDVERMFIEKTQVYPHSLDEVQFTRNNLVSGVLRVALSAFLECVRSSVFSSLGYRQMKVDAILIRYLLPHFVKDEFGTPEANACTSLFNILDDIMLKAGQRCVDPDVVGDDDFYDADKDEIVTPYYLVRQFLISENADESTVMKRIAFV